MEANRGATLISNVLRKAIFGKTTHEIYQGTGVPQDTINDFLAGSDLRLSTTVVISSFLRLKLVLVPGDAGEEVTQPSRMLPTMLRENIRTSALSATAIAKAAGISHATMSRFMRGGEIRLRAASSIAAYFGIQMKPS